ncbi:MAG: LysM peptidoglycan-binding domain-containing protein [Anaerolineae bacterium]
MQADIGKGPMLYAVAVALCCAVLLMLAAPGMAQAVPSGDTIVYVVRPGDRLADIAARYGVTVSSIVQANGLNNPDVIYPGQRLKIPVGGSAAGGSSTRYYTVQASDTLDKIARTHGVSASALIAANNITNPNLIWVGQRLLIPTTAGSTPQPLPPTPSATPKPISAAPVVHVVQAGETLSQIAQRYSTTVAALVAANGLGSTDLIRVGMRLTIPKASSPSQGSYAGQAARFVVSISQQRCWLYRGEVLVSQWVCSTGRPGAATRPGTYRVQSKLPKAYGSTWNIWMPYWLGIYWAGASENGIHGLPWNATTGAQVWTGYVGTPITYGCVMLDNVNAKMLYDVAYIGMPVIIKP